MISVIIATKNGGAFLKRSVNSVLSQTYKDLELVIVSDGSTDNTAELARSLAFSDQRIKVIELKENIGPGLARNKAIEMAQGEYIAILDDDDVWLSANKLSVQKEYLDGHKDTVAVGASRVQFVREESSEGGQRSSEHTFWLNQEKDPKKIKAKMLSYSPLITSSVLFRKDIFMKVGCFKDMRLAEDYDLWLRMGQFGKIANIDGAETKYVVRDSGASLSNRLKMCYVVINLAKEYRPYYPNYAKAVMKGYARLIYASCKLLAKKLFK